jgi:hypothetical protein
MNKKFTLATLLLVFFAFTAQAQLPDGSIAPDFTVTDLDGNEWNLYDILDEGKMVIIDAYATWCGPCWNYHQAGTLKDIWNQYGPDGTDEIFVIAIEADPSTTLGDIYGTGSNTIGDWTEGIPYPMADYGAFNALYDIAFFPTLYTICPNRTLIESGQVSLDDHYANIGGCLFPGGDVNAGVLQYEGFEGQFCNDVAFEPSIKVQNIGSSDITTLDVELSLNGAQAEVVNWEGTLAPYETVDVMFAEVMLIEDTEVAINVTSVNGTMDDFNIEDNVVVRNATLGQETDQTVFTLELTTDQYSAETYWELLDGNGTALYSGGNPGIFQGIIAEGSYDQNSTYTIEMPLPADGCFELNVYDAFGDGLCCEFGEGGYSLTDAVGNVLVEGGSFTSTLESTPFELAGAEGTPNNAAIVLYTGESGEFCGAFSMEPQVAVQNLGSTNITTMTVTLSNNGELVQSLDWTGDLESGQFAPVSFDELDLVEDAALSFEIQTVNGEADTYDYQNSLAVELNRVPLAATEEITVEIQT